MSAAPSLLSAAVRQLSRSAHGVVVSPARGFQLFRIDGYSWTKTLPAGDRITSEPFAVGGRDWLIDYYPNGGAAASATTNHDSNSDAIGVALRLSSGGYQRERARAEFKFSLLDAAGNAAYELPAETAVFTSHRDDDGDHDGDDDGVGFGHAEFLTKEELERRRETLLVGDCLAIRCDVGVAELGVVAVAPKESHHNASWQQEEDDDDDWEGEGRRQRRRQKPPMDDREYVRRCLAKNRRP